MPQTVLIALHQQAVARDRESELSQPQADECQGPSRLTTCFWLLMAAALVSILLAEWLVAHVIESRVLAAVGPDPMPGEGRHEGASGWAGTR